MRFGSNRLFIAAAAAAVALVNVRCVRAEEGKVVEAGPTLEQQIGALVAKLNEGKAEERDAAENTLLELAGTTASETDKFLELLPEESDQMPLALRERLSQIRQQVEARMAKSAIESTIITLSANDMPLKEVFAAIQEQTGNRLIDNREQPAEDANVSPSEVTIELKAEPFWPAMDQILDQVNLGIYSYGGEDALSIVSRTSDERPRHGAAHYAGPFRVAAIEVQSQRSLRQPNNQSLKLQLEVAWEPRLRPIAISLPVATLSATTDTGQQLSVSQPNAVIDVEAPTGTQAAELVVSFNLPPRESKRITTLRGKLRALVPGRQVKFRFDDLANSVGKSESRGGVSVTLDDVRKNNAIWEVHMRLTMDESNTAMETHQSWAFQNLSYLVGPDGTSIDNAGFETIRQTRNEVGIAYLFDLPEGVDELSWVYETPAAIVELPIEYELKDIELP